MPSTNNKNWKIVKGAFVAWTPYAGRTQGFIDALDLEPMYIHYLKLRRPVYAPFKYPFQFFATIKSLFKTHPNLVFVMDPPVFAVLPVFIYSLITKAAYIIDCHSGVFESSKWKWSLPLQRFFVKRASATIVTNSDHKNMIASWNAYAIIMSNPPPKIPKANTMFQPQLHQKMILVINRFDKDEALDEVLEAAKRLPDTHFFITGDKKRAKAKWIENHPSNVTFTGWIPNEEYWHYLQNVNAVLTLIDQPKTILQGGWEALYVGQPLITSNTQTLQNYFTKGTVFVENTPEGIEKGINQCLLEEDTLRREMSELRAIKCETWLQELHELEEHLEMKFSIAPHIL